MRALVVGGDGLIGSALVQLLLRQSHTVFATTRRSDGPPERLPCDLLKPSEFMIPERIDAAFLCAGINGFKECEGVALSHRVNVDGNLLIGLRLIEAGAFVIYVSTQAVEWLGSAYARQRSLVETGLLAASRNHCVIMRVGKVTADNSALCAEALATVAQAHRAGVHHWPE